MNKEILGSLGWGVGIVALALAATLARKLGFIDSETVTRLVIGTTGLMIVWFGNQLPKTFVPSAWARQLRRVTGWSLVISGLVYAGLWALAPVSVAVVGGCVAVAAGMAVTIGYGLSLRAKGKAANSGAA